VSDAKPEALIRVRGVTKRFGDVTAVNDVSLDILKGELFAILGSSGCGKTTLLRMLAGFEQPTSGRILIDGADMTDVPPYERPVNLMFQSYALFPHMTVHENVAYGLRKERAPAPKIRERVAEMLAMVGFQAIGCDLTILLAAQAGQLELNVMVPVVAFNLLHQLEILRNGTDAFHRLCVSGITADEQRCRQFAEASMSLVTVLTPRIGYARAAQIVKDHLSSGTPIRQLILDSGLLTGAEIDEAFDFRRMTEPGIPAQGLRP